MWKTHVENLTSNNLKQYVLTLYFDDKFFGTINKDMFYNVDTNNIKWMTFFKKLKALMSCAHGSCETRAQMPDVMDVKFLDTIVLCF